MPMNSIQSTELKYEMEKNELNCGKGCNRNDNGNFGSSTEADGRTLARLDGSSGLAV